MIFSLGLVSYGFLLATGASMGLARRRGKRRPVEAHHWLAYTTVAVATLHALLGIVTRIPGPLSVARLPWAVSVHGSRTTVYGLAISIVIATSPERSLG